MWNLGWRPRKKTTKAPPPSPAQLEICVDLIRQHRSAGREELNEPQCAVIENMGDSEAIFIEFVNRETIPIGTIYRSWAVIFRNHDAPQVMYLRSRRGENGDSTLPPE